MVRDPARSAASRKSAADMAGPFVIAFKMI
jgi:hypothetical protein